MNPLSRPLALLAALAFLAPAALAADPPAGKKNCADGIKAHTGKFCESFEDCAKFCICACTFDKHKWKPDMKNDGSTVCPGAPLVPPGAPDPEVVDLPTYRFITHRARARAGRIAAEALRRIDEQLAASQDQADRGYTVHVVSCYRPHLEDTVPECGFVLKSVYMLSKVTEPEKRAKWIEHGNPRNLGLSWPGVSPHSAGIACDLILRDAKGKDCFDSRAGVPGAPTCDIDQREASGIMDQLVTDAEGRRLTYEAWHYEWGDGSFGSGTTCQAPVCGEKYWPVTGKPPSRKKK